MCSMSLKTAFDYGVYPAGIYLFKFNNGNKNVRNKFKVTTLLRSFWGLY